MLEVIASKHKSNKKNVCIVIGITYGLEVVLVKQLKVESSLVKDACCYVAGLASRSAQLFCVRQNVLRTQPSTKPSATPDDPYWR